jgi:hypothetical protein
MPRGPDACAHHGRDLAIVLAISGRARAQGPRVGLGSTQRTPRGTETGQIFSSIAHWVPPLDACFSATMRPLAHIPFLGDLGTLGGLRVESPSPPRCDRCDPVFPVTPCHALRRAWICFMVGSALATCSGNRPFVRPSGLAGERGDPVRLGMDARGHAGPEEGPRRRQAPSSAPRAARALSWPRLRADIWIAEWGRVPRRNMGPPAQTDTRDPSDRTDDRHTASHCPDTAPGRTGESPVRQPARRSFPTGGRSLLHQPVQPPRRAHPVPGAARHGGTPEFTTI